MSGEKEREEGAQLEEVRRKGEEEKRGGGWKVV